MKILLLVLGGLCFGGLGPVAAAPANANATLCRMTVEMRDGSRVVGTPVDKYFRFHSALLGEVKLAVPDIRSVECLSTNSARLITSGGDQLMVWFAADDFSLQTSFGKIEVAVASLRKFTVSTGLTGGARVPGLVALWSGEGDGKDSVANHDADLMDITFADGKLGQAFSFNGYSSWGVIPAQRGLDLENADGLTIAVWIDPSDVDGFHPILEWQVTRQKNAVMLWIGHLPQDHGVLSGNIGDTTGTSHPINSPQGTIVANKFQHVALTYDKTSGVSRLFVNGRIVAEQNIGVVTPDTFGPLFLSRRPADQPGDWTYDKFFAGLMDQIAIYNRALSPEEIRSLSEAAK